MRTRNYIDWIRVSTDAQADRGTPEVQRNDLTRLAANRPGVLVKRVDYVGSGAKANEEREDVREVFALLATANVDEVRVWRIDRITRSPDPRERAAILGALIDAGAVIVEATGRMIDPADEMGELDLTLQGWMASRERKRIAERTTAGKKRAAAAGRLVQGRPPFGRTFDKVTGTWGVDPERAKTYRKMFDLALSGSSLTQIAAKLNAHGSVSPRGKLWTDANVSRLLRDEAAFGKYSAQGHTFTIPAIIDEPMFNATRRVMESNNCLSGPKPQVFALLRKIGVCGECESPLYIQLGGAESRIRYYHCSAHNEDCHRYLRVDDVDAKVVARLRRWLDDPKTLNDAAGRGASENAGEAAKRDIAEAERDLRDLDRQEEGLARLLSKGLTAKTNEKLLGEIQRNRADAQNRIAQAKARLDDASRQDEFAKSLAEVMAGMRKRLASDSPARWRELVEIVFPPGGIRVFPDGAIEFDGRIPVGQPVQGVNRKAPHSRGRTST